MVVTFDMVKNDDTDGSRGVIEMVRGVGGDRDGYYHGSETDATGAMPCQDGGCTFSPNCFASSAFFKAPIVGKYRENRMGQVCCKTKLEP